jgi:hypothetical protein
VTDAVVLINDGDAHFALDQRFDLGENPEAQALADFDDDGDLDLAVADSDGDSVNVLFNGCGAAPCLADLAPPFGLLDLADITAFVDAFQAGDPSVDFDNSGLLDLEDISAFAAAFNGGCD